MYLSNPMQSYSVIPFIFQVSSILSTIYISDTENSYFAHIFLFCIKYFYCLLCMKSQCKDLSHRKWMWLITQYSALKVPFCLIWDYPENICHSSENTVDYLFTCLSSLLDYELLEDKYQVFISPANLLEILSLINSFKVNWMHLNIWKMTLRDI